MKKKTYKLKDLSYMSLSLNYLALMAVTVVITILTAGLTSSGGNWLMLFISLVIGGSITFFIYRTGIKYGQHGLVILMGKLFQPKHIKNDFPLFAKNLVVNHSSQQSQNTNS